VAEAQVDYLIRIAEVERQTGLARSTIYRRMAEGTFPLAVGVGRGQVRWRQSEVTRWRDSLEPVRMRAPPPHPVADAGR
jgi:prophage regulatory protein